MRTSSHRDPPRATPAPRERLDPMVWRISSVVLLGPLMTSIDSTVVNVSLDHLSRDLHAPLTAIQWVASAYLLALALMLPLSGWLVDRIGAKRVYLGCFTAFTFASVMCGMATTPGQLIAARVLQGMAGGLIAPMAQMMTARIAGPHVARVLGIMVVPVLIGPILGPVLAGEILQHASWRWIFFINLPVGVLAIVLAQWILPDDDDESQRRSFDAVGFVLLSPGLVFLLHGFERLGSSAAATRAPLFEVGVALAMLAAFVRHAWKKGRLALVDLRLFQRKPFSAAASTQFLSSAVAYGGQLLLPLYLLGLRGRPPGETGLLLAPLGVGMMCVYPFMGSLTDRFGSRALSSAGAFVALLGTLPFALASGTTLSMTAIEVALFVRGVGLAAINIPSIAAAYAGIEKPLIPVATTALNIAQRLGGPAMTTLVAVFLHAQLAAAPDAASSAYGATFWLLCGVHALTALSALRLPRRA